MKSRIDNTRISPEQLPASATPVQPRRVSSRDLLGQAREVVIQHGGDEYRLRLTSQNKLILNK